MNKPVTVLAPIKLATGKTEADLLAASEVFQNEFVNRQPGVLRRELVRKPDGTYLDIVQFRSAADAATVIEEEQSSPVCLAFFAIMDLGDMEEEAQMDLYPSLATYSGNG